MIFQGTNALALDAKGRMNVPQKHRDALLELCSGALTLTKHQDGCLQLLPRGAWETLRAKLMAMPMSAAAVKRLYLGSAMDVEIDSAGRILIAPELREYARITRDVVLMGMGQYFEIWDARTHAENESKALSAGGFDILNDLSF